MPNRSGESLWKNWKMQICFLTKQGIWARNEMSPWKGVFLQHSIRESAIPTVPDFKICNWYLFAQTTSLIAPNWLCVSQYTSVMPTAHQVSAKFIIINFLIYWRERLLSAISFGWVDILTTFNYADARKGKIFIQELTVFSSCKTDLFPLK